MIDKQILRLSIPNIVTNITIPLLASFDLGLMGHSGSIENIGAIAIGTMIFSFLFWLFSFLRMGTSGFTAQAYGEQNKEKYFNILLLSSITAFSIGLILIILQKPIGMLAINLVKSSTEVEMLAMQYFKIRIYAAPATLFIYVVTGWLIGMQNAKYPMIIAISINVINIFLSYTFINFFNFGVNGVAWANVISQNLGLLLSLFLIRKYIKQISVYSKFKNIFENNFLTSFFSVNKDIFIRTFCLIFTLSFFTIKSASYNETYLAINSLLFQFFYFFSYFIDGFGYAAEALSGKYYGMKDMIMLRKTIKRLFQYGIWIAVVFTFIYLFFNDYLLQMLTNDQAVLNQAKPFMKWVIFIPLLSFSAFIWDGIYVGVTASKAMRNSMLINTVLIFLPAFYILTKYIDNHGLWIAFLLFMLFRGVLLSVLANKNVYIFDKKSTKN